MHLKIERRFRLANYWWNIDLSAGTDIHAQSVTFYSIKIRP